jgi:uncharacterized protein (TIGR04551 family)
MLRVRWLVVLLAIAVAAPAAAQMPPGMGGPGGGRPPPKPDEEKEEGQAEQAPPSSQEEPTLQAIPSYPGQTEREVQFLELHGYFRLRTDYFRKFNLSFKETQSPPYPTPVCSRSLSVASGTIAAGSMFPSVCGDNATSDANVRFRLEPTFNISEHVRIRAQIDMLDNLVLGSTPESWASGATATARAPIGFLSQTQVAPIAGRNSFSDSIMVKRAWGEVRLPVGELSFGRMPGHWGLGILENAGACLDCDYGTSVDRIQFSAPFAGHVFTASYGWINTSLTSGQTSNGIGSYGGQAYNLDTKWGTSEWLFKLGRLDKPAEWKERVARGDVAINYGMYHGLRFQENDLAYNCAVAPGIGATDETCVLGAKDSQGQTTTGGLRDMYVKRNAWSWTPDIWFKLTWKGLDVELEALYVLGNIGNATDISNKLDKGLEIRKWAAVARGQYRFLADALRVGLEIGSASGDATENNPQTYSYLNVLNAPFAAPTVGSATLGRFLFNPDYHVDEILWRRIYGTVNNATYFKPSIAYDIVESFGARLDMIYSLANNPVATPGNSVNMGLELNLSIGYHNDDEGFFAGATYGVLFPFEALDHPATLGGQPFWTTGSGNSHPPQVLRFWVGIKF